MRNTILTAVGALTAVLTASSASASTPDLAVLAEDAGSIVRLNDYDGLRNNVAAEFESVAFQPVVHRRGRSFARHRGVGRSRFVGGRHRRFGNRYYGSRFNRGFRGRQFRNGKFVNQGFVGAPGGFHGNGIVVGKAQAIPHGIAKGPAGGAVVVKKPIGKTVGGKTVLVKK